jgi:small ligand-binding sensory domain FIST
MSFAFGSGLSTEADSARAAGEAIAQVLHGLGGRRPDLAILFLSPHHAGSAAEILERVSSGLSPRRFLGCLGQGVIGDGREVEGGEGLCLLGASLPGVEIAPARIGAVETPEGLAFSGFGEPPEGEATLLLLGEPYTFPVVEFLTRLEEDHPRLQVIGGMASGAMGPGEGSLFLDGEVVGEGAVGVVLSGPLRVRPLVSQGCRPFGKHLVITRADETVILELGGQPALERLKEQIVTLSRSEQGLLQQGLHLGRAIDPRRTSFSRGDFLVRNVVGIDPEKGGIAIADPVRPGQTVQFHLRDARSASEELDLLLKEARDSGVSPAGALLFSCNGRGSYLFKKPDHDAGAVRRELGQVPLAGFFAAGELGPVGGRNFLHGFTASLALFEEA